MTLVSAAIPNFINGISQQPPTLRLASQLQEQINGYSVVADGLVKRPPAENVAKLYDTPVDGAYVHFIERQSWSRQALIITHGNLRVFGEDGTERTVYFPDGKGYLQHFAQFPTNECFAALTVLDYTFIVNSTKVTELDEAKTVDVDNPSALLWVRQGAYGATYSVTLGGTTFTHTTPDGSSASHSLQVGTNYIATQIRDLIVANPDYTVDIINSVLRVRRADDANFTLVTTSGGGGDYLKGIKGGVRSFTDLPATAFDGFYVEVRGSEGNSADNYWVQYDAATLQWLEIPAPGRKYEFKWETMPHILVHEADGTFTFKMAEWARCNAGSTETCPDPSFTGGYIQDVIFYRDRLGFLAGESVILSQAGQYFNFWRQTARQLLDDDRIDIASTHVRASSLYKAVIFDEDLILFSDQTQFALRAGDILRPQAAALVPITEYEVEPNVRPVAAGSAIFFGTQRGGWTAIREMVVQGAARRTEAPDATAHVPRYIPWGLRGLTAATNEDSLFCLAAGDRRNVFVYRFFDVNNERVQSSWSRWQWPEGASIQNISALNSVLLAVVNYPDGAFLERIDLSRNRGSKLLDFAPLIDRLITNADLSGNYYDGTAWTYYTLPYEVGAGDVVEVVSQGTGTNPHPKGYRFPVERVSNTQVRIRGNIFGENTWIGIRYAFDITLSRFLLREDVAGGGQSALTAGRLTIQNCTVTFADTGYLRVEVTPRDRETFSKVYSGYVAGSSETLMGSMPSGDGKLRFGVMAANDLVTIRIINDSPLPSKILTAEWTGRWTTKAIRRS